MKKTTEFRSSFAILLVIIFCLRSFSCAYGANPKPKNVQTSVRAKWSGTPLLLEACELLSREWKDLFWDFVETWIQNEEHLTDTYTARDCLKKILRHGNSLLSDSLQPVFEFSLYLRSASPRVVLYRQLAAESLSSFLLSQSSSSKLDSGLTGHTDSLKSRKLDYLLVGANPESPKGKCCWVDIGGSLFFDVADLESWFHSPSKHTKNMSQQPELFDFDHLYLDSNISSPVAILYGALGTDCFKEFHQALAAAGKKGKVRYIVRPVLPSGCEKRAGACGGIGVGNPVNLGGYGVELALKNMEYKAMDDSTVKKGITLEDPRIEDLTQEVRGFIFSKIIERKPELKFEIMTFRDYLLSSTISDTLDVWDLKDLGHQTAQRIVQASDPLQSMQEISQNFPSVVSSLSRMKLNDSVKDEIIANQRMIPPGKSLIALNGALLNIEDIDLYLLTDLVHQDLSLADQFMKMKIPGSTVHKLLTSTPPRESNMIRIDFRSNHVHYLNNLEEDDMYKRWRSNLNEILMPVFPGQLRYLRKNLYHAVLVIDPSSLCGLEAVDMITSLYENNFPVRFGVILYSSDLTRKIEMSGTELNGVEGIISQEEEELSSLVIRLFMYIKENHGSRYAFQFLSNVNRQRTESDSVGDSTEIHHVESAFVETVLPKSKAPPQDILLKLEKDQTFKEAVQESSLSVFKLGLAKLQCTLLMNGLVVDANEEALLNAMNEELPRIQEQVYYGQIDSRTDVLDKFLSENGINRYNPQIIAEGKIKPRFISLASAVLGGEPVVSQMDYLHSPGSIDDLKPVTHLLSVDVTSKEGIKLLHEGIRYLMGGAKIARLGLLFNANQDAGSSSLLFVKVLRFTISSYSYNKGVLNFLDHLCSFYEQNYGPFPIEAESTQINKFMDKVYELADENGLSSNAYKSMLEEFAAGEIRGYLNEIAKFLYKVHGVHGVVNSVITNGRVMFPLAGSSFLSDDLGLLETVEFKQRIKYILEIIEEVKWQDMDPDSLTSKFLSDVIMHVSSAMATRQRSSESARFEVLNSKYSAVILGHENASIHIDAVVDPLCPLGQKLASLLRVLWKYAQPSMRIVLNPMSSLVDLPLKNYYRYVLPTMDDYSTIDHSVNGPKAFFANMPLSKTLTMNLDVPEPWLVEPVVAVHDLDNILLENLGDTRTLQAVFELEALVLTGHCSEKDHEPPRGLQLILGTESRPHLVDTLVMANLGYWQMKVSPGIWYLQLAPGRSSELYSVKGDENGNEDSSSLLRITINDLRGKVVYLDVMKKKGKEHEKLLVSTDDDESSHETKGTQNSWNSNLLKWASGLIGGNEHPKRSENTSIVNGRGDRKGKPVNIFSIASGHLYERFLKIMILSVLSNTKRPVKFWFIKNYLSPQFKDVIPHMAEEYGFDYELITYKWPTWLHKQKEKQRIIWAYKILFLDVIFPLSLEKVIFVDADQVVRADMGELYDMDLKGRPLAYTPFCDNNRDMDGYRFWRQGFWKEHLRGRPYHISALYVVDLVKFRESAAGDNLRVVYESLSKDPNSLSNLDQDLPNYAQHTVPIFSLPQEWLWCESWCGDATKSKAKTIDLCNNPMTKEPKLEGARRIIPEWVHLDSEARGFTAKILGDEEADAQLPVESPQLHGVVEEQLDVESKAEL